MKKPFCATCLGVLMACACGFASDFSTDPNRTTIQPAPLNLLAPGPNSITQNTDTTTIIGGNSVSCNNANGHTDNGYFRRFYLNADHGIVGAFSVTSVDIGIDSATGANGSQPLTVNLYSIPSGSALLMANLTLIGTTSLLVADATLAPLNIPVTGTILTPDSLDLVVEVFTPNGQTVGNFFFIGSNDLGQTHPGYLMASDCSVAEPTDTATIGFPNMHIIMVVNGDEEVSVPTLGAIGLGVLVTSLAGAGLFIRRRKTKV